MSAVAKMLLCHLLDCREADLEVLEGCTYEIYDLVGTASEIDEHPTLKDYVEAMIKIGLSVLRDSISDRMEATAIQDDARSNECNEELNAIRCLNPFVDIEVRFNYRDTHISFLGHEEVYRKYFEHDLECFHNGTGFWIEGR